MHNRRQAAVVLGKESGLLTRKTGVLKRYRPIKELCRVGQVPARPNIYHITHVDNLRFIAREGSILSDKTIQMRGGPPTSIGMPQIKGRRTWLPVKCYDGDCVGDYVPFYFCPRSIMLYLIHMGNHPGLSYRGGQDAIVHIEADLIETVEWAEQGDHRWAFTLSNAGAAYTVFRNRMEHLHDIDWDAVQARDFRDPIIKEGKQAEFLLYGAFPWNLVRRIGVHSGSVLDIATNVMSLSDHSPVIEVRRDWYF